MPDYEGTSDKHEGIERAFEKAWEKMAKEKKDKGDAPDPRNWYEATIYVQGSNPINQYKVKIKD